MLDELGLIHMNGRIYDPLLGKMLSADPNIQSPSNLQNYNRYSYVTNNPLSMTDPSGFFFKKLFKKVAKFFKKFFTTIVTIALALIPGVGPFLAAAWMVGVGYYYGGIKGALTAAVGIALTAGIGGYFDGLYAPGAALDSGIELARATAHGIAQGGLAEISGGDFGDGFLAAFSGSIAGSLMSGTKTGRKVFGEPGDKSAKYIARRTVAASVVGGTVSEIGGGNFANGAATAAMTHLFNSEDILGVHSQRSKHSAGLKEFGDSLSDSDRRKLLIETTPDASDSAFVAGLDTGAKGGLAYFDNAVPIVRAFKPFEGWYDSSDPMMQLAGTYGNIGGHATDIAIGGAIFNRFVSKYTLRVGASVSYKPGLIDQAVGATLGAEAVSQVWNAVGPIETGIKAYKYAVEHF